MSDDSIPVLIFVVGIILVIILAILNPSKEGTPEERCQKAYGEQYHYIDGDRSPDLCVSKNGSIRYYDLIK